MNAATDALKASGSISRPGSQLAEQGVLFVALIRR